VISRTATVPLVVRNGTLHEMEQVEDPPVGGLPRRGGGRGDRRQVVPQQEEAQAVRTTDGHLWRSRRTRDFCPLGEWLNGILGDLGEFRWMEGGSATGNGNYGVWYPLFR
jgi:hypothetical protein